MADYLKIQVNAPFFSNIEDESRSDVVSEQRRDVIKDTLGTTIKRPCLSNFATDLISEPIDGQFYWDYTDKVYAVSDTNLYSIDNTGSSTLIASGLFTEGEHVTWSESSDLTLITAGATRKLIITNGGRIVVYDGITASAISDADAPTECSHTIVFDTYLLANDLGNTKWEESVKYSKVADPTNFEGAFFSAENKSDPINAILTSWDEIAIFGPRSIQNFYNDRVEPFSPIPGGSIQSGTLSPWTIQIAGDSYIYLDAGRKLIRLTGRQPVEISQAIDDLLDGDVDYENAEGEVFTLRSKKLYILTINDRTFVYDYELNEWVGEWGFWNDEKAIYEKFRARNFINVKQWGLTLCTDKESGSVFKIDFETYQDFGNEVRSSVITGNIDHGTGKEKRSNELRVRLKRGDVERTDIDQVEPKLLVRWRDNGEDEFYNWREIGLGFKGDTKFYYSIFMLGSYQTRQYEFMCSDNTPFSLVEVEEDVTLLR